MFQLRCHRCSSWMGESDDKMELVGVFRDPRDVEMVAAPRYTWRCKSCGWANVFRKVVSAAWRSVELKKG